MYVTSISMLQAVRSLHWFRFRRTTVIIWALFGLIIGLWLSKENFAVNLTIVLSIVCLLPLAITRKFRAILIVFTIGLVLGLWRGGYVKQQLYVYQNLRDKNVELSAKIIDDSAYSKDGQREFFVSNIRFKNCRQYCNTPGKIRIRSRLLNAPIRGSRVDVKGVLREGFGSYQAAIYYADVSTSKDPISILEIIRLKFFAGMRSAVPEPQASLGLGFLVGLRSLLPDQLLDELRRTGLTHIVAVSGYNLTVLVRLTRRLLAKHSKYWACVSAVALIIFFLSVTGLASSIFRASIVAFFALAAWYYGRPIRPMMLLGLSGAITATINPLLIWYDIGWWLSFLAFFGVLIVGPIFCQRVFKKSPSELPIFGQIILETSAAQIMTMPLIVFIFGEVSLVSLLSNILILPLVPLAMLLSFIAGTAGAVATPIAGWFSWPATILLTAITDIVRILSSLPFAFAENIKMTQFEMVFIYCVIILVVWWMYWHLSQENKKQLSTQNYLD